MINENGKLNQLFKKHGLYLIKDQSRCEALIRDYCIGTPQEVNLLLLALKAQIPLQLIEGKENLSQTVKNLARKLQDKHFVAFDAANNIVEHWVAGIGLNSRETQLPSSEKVTESKDLEIELSKGISLEMVLIPAGKFKMGSPASEKGRGNFEKQHEVTLTNSFYMGKYQVTQEQWDGVLGNNSSIKTTGAMLPVTNVSWEDCQEFIKKLNTKTNGGYRLPTEAEWEYACRAGTTTAYSFGDKITPRDANYKDSKIGKPVAVGSYKPNAFGLYDMHGNVWEWCEDWYGDYPTSAGIDPRRPEAKESHVLRGGSFCSDVSRVRSSLRYNVTPTFRYDDFGFRLVRII